MTRDTREASPSGWKERKSKKVEKETATHSSIRAWKSPRTEEPGGLQSMGLHDWACVHEDGERWVGSNKLGELKKKKKEKKGMSATAKALGFSWWLSGKESACQCRRHRFNPCSGKIPCASEQLSPCTTTTKLVPYSLGVATIKPTYHSDWSLQALEPVVDSEKSHCREQPTYCNWRVVSALCN